MFATANGICASSAEVGALPTVNTNVVPSELYDTRTVLRADTTPEISAAVDNFFPYK